MKLVKYDAACRALAAARTADEVMAIRDKALALAACAKIAKNKDLEADAFELRIKAERRLGEMMEKGKADRAGIGKRVLRKPFKPSLAESGIGKNLADRARKLYALPLRDFKRLIADGRADVSHSVERAVLSKINRAERHAAIAKTCAALSGRFAVIYADPPWRWGHFGELGNVSDNGKGRTPDQHYPTLDYEQLKVFHIDGRLISDIAHDDAALFLWATAANLPYALEVMRAWDFTYKAQAVWVKDKSGLGLVFRNQHEVLLYGSRGAMPGPRYQPASVFAYPRGRHSEKPAAVRTVIERMYPDFNAAARLELFAREHSEGWTAWGYEVADDRGAGAAKVATAGNGARPAPGL
jgi:N6-adenosine-specific RNA methylase IME4